MTAESTLLERLHWDDVRIFLALCRSNSLGQAARALGVDGSTVSRRLAAMEEVLAASLFERGRTGVSVTDAAERLLPVAEEIEAAMTRFAGAAEGLEREVAGLVRIACPPDAAEVLVAPLLPRLFAAHPRLQVEIIAGERLVDLARRDADLALRTVRPEHGDLIVTKLLRITWRAAVSARLAPGRTRLRKWADVDWIFGTERLAESSPGRWCQSELEGVVPRVSTSSLRVQVAAVEAGLGAALLPAQSLPHYGLSALELAPPLRRSAAPWPEDDVYLVTHRALRRVPRVAAVWELFTEQRRTG